MSEEREPELDPRANRTPPGTAPDRATDSSNINPYQAPAYHPEDAIEKVEANRPAMPGNRFWIAAGLAIALTLVVTAATDGVAFPFFMATVGGTIRSVLIFKRQSPAARASVSPVVLLITSTFLTFLLMFCCVLAFFTICTTGTNSRTMGMLPWMVIAAVVALAVFIFTFILSLRWSV